MKTVFLYAMGLGRVAVLPNPDSYRATIAVSIAPSSVVMLASMGKPAP